VNVLAVPEGVLQRVDIGDVSQQAQLDLGIVGRHDDIALIGGEGFADLAAFLGADRDVLQVRLGAGQPPVDVAASEKLVCTRPVSGLMASFRASE
jgi:hypothetical protein